MYKLKKLRSYLQSKLHSNLYLIAIISGLFITVIILTYLIVNVVWINGEVRGKSMQPNFYNGDRYLPRPPLLFIVEILSLLIRLDPPQINPLSKG